MKKNNNNNNNLLFVNKTIRYFAPSAGVSPLDRLFPYLIDFPFLVYFFRFFFLKLRYDLYKSLSRGHELYKRGPKRSLPPAPWTKPNALCDLFAKKMSKFDMFKVELWELCELFTFFWFHFPRTHHNQTITHTQIHTHETKQAWWICNRLTHTWTLSKKEASKTKTHTSWNWTFKFLMIRVVRNLLRHPVWRCI